jgi:hypothetical protein
MAYEKQNRTKGHKNLTPNSNGSKKLAKVREAPISKKTRNSTETPNSARPERKMARKAPKNSHERQPTKREAYNLGLLHPATSRRREESSQITL